MQRPVRDKRSERGVFKGGVRKRKRGREWPQNMYLDYADDNVLQARPFRVVVQQQFAILFRAAKRGRPHARIQGAQMVVQGVQILFG